MRKVDLKYKTENLKEWELKSLSEKNEFGKLTVKFILSISLFIVIFILIFPYLPPIKPGREYNPPKNLNEYFEDISFTAILIFSILFLTYTFKFLRNKIDEKSNIKKVGNFEIKRIINFGKNTFIQMNNLKFIIIKNNYVGLKNTKVGQIITVKKTITSKIINLYIRDKSKFETE
jgi:hypothetical protein